MLGPLVALAATLHAQAPDSTSERAAIAAFDTTVAAVTVAAGAFRTDLPYASRDLVIARADRLRRDCANAAARAARLDPLLAGRGAPLRDALKTLLADLKRCDADFATGPGHAAVDSVRAWAPYRLARLDDAVRRYRVAARVFPRRRYGR